MDREFFEERGLYAKYSCWDDKDRNLKFSAPPLQLTCKKCKGVRTWKEQRNIRHRIGTRVHGADMSHWDRSAITEDQNLSGAITLFEYDCAECGSPVKFMVYIHNGVCMKVGQYPAPSIEIDAQLEKLLGEYAERYKHGLICENQGFGIGAFGYYRRIVEGIIEKLLKEIAEIVEAEKKPEYLAALAAITSSHQAKEKIDLVKELLPPSLRPQNMNPLAIIYRSLSEGLHAQDDQTCLSDARQIRAALEYLIDKISSERTAQVRFTESMHGLLGKKSSTDTDQSSKPE